ncbi:hypothetical protein THAOC_15136 [Thalassiosira oceanica]|uniref:Uncharacterized protein n=1 Tax=Thalassiosira oceanica TaxID=159749 RepID=K0T161_THAOC|nr:hypothetical protein THAOC_15136 [Thalassiosira oceanica]|eukprot:EJK64157.1 hypothetical protein THAOC_15136 [Thalassiosira oceanica]
MQVEPSAAAAEQDLTFAAGLAVVGSVNVFIQDAGAGGKAQLLLLVASRSFEAPHFNFFTGGSWAAASANRYTQERNRGFRSPERKKEREGRFRQLSNHTKLSTGLLGWLGHQAEQHAKRRRQQDTEGTPARQQEKRRSSVTSWNLYGCVAIDRPAWPNTAATATYATDWSPVSADLQTSSSTVVADWKDVGPDIPPSLVDTVKVVDMGEPKLSWPDWNPGHRSLISPRPRRQAT